MRDQHPSVEMKTEQGVYEPITHILCFIQIATKFKNDWPPATGHGCPLLSTAETKWATVQVQQEDVW